MLEQTRGKGPLLRRLFTALTASGWDVSANVDLDAASQRRRIDLVARKGPESYAIDVRAAQDERGSNLLALAAAGLLEARRLAALLSARPLVVIGASQLSPSSVREVRLFVEEFGDGICWGVVDQAGLLELHGPGLHDVVEPR